MNKFKITVVTGARVFTSEVATYLEAPDYIAQIWGTVKGSNAFFISPPGGVYVCVPGAAIEAIILEPAQDGN